MFRFSILSHIWASSQTLVHGLPVSGSNIILLNYPIDKTDLCPIPNVCLTSSGNIKLVMNTF